MVKLRVLQVCSADSLGGGELHVSDLARALREREHEVHLAVRRSSPLRKLLDQGGFHWHELPLRNAADLGSAHAIARIIRKYNIDVLHAHVARDFTVCGVAARLTDVNFFLTRHHFGPIKRSRLYGWAIHRVRNLIAVSASVGRSLAEAFPQLADRIVVIPNWIDPQVVATLSRVESRAHFSMRRPLAVAVIGQLAPIKGQDDFLRAVARLKDAGFEKTDFFLIGEAAASDKNYKRRLQTMARELGIDDQVRFAGYVSGVARYLAAFDIVVAPSENEAFSLAVVEAMVAGSAVVASRVGGMAETVDDEVTGLLVPPNDVDALAAAMSRLLESETLRGRLGQAGAADARERFDRRRVIDRIEALYLAGADHLR
jgi:glycosyltransferase involved in cell wall biosynthesis